MAQFEITYNIRGQVMIDAMSEEQARDIFFDGISLTNTELLEGADFNMQDLGNDALEILDIQKEEPRDFVVHARLPLRFKLKATDQDDAEDQVTRLLDGGLTSAEMNNYIDGDIEIGTVEEE